MAADLGSDSDELVSQINITPFVDIILVVLIIFMVTATAIVRQAIEVKLPDAATGSTAETSLALSIDAGGRWYLDGTPITPDGLRAALKQAKAQGGEDITCLLAADHRVPHGEVVRAIDLIKQEGIARFAINIDPVPLPPEAP
jgi:biopolymer transport protein TolR